MQQKHTAVLRLMFVLSALVEIYRPRISQYYILFFQ